MAKRKEQPAEEGSPAWMSTFSDLMNLLLCFFVLLFASSTMDEGKIQKIAASFENATFSIFTNSTTSMLSGQILSGGIIQIPDAEATLSAAGQSIRTKNGGEYDSASPSDAASLSDAELMDEYEKRGKEQSEDMYDEIVQLMESYRIDDIVDMDYTAQYVELDLSGSILFDSGSAAIKDDSKLFLQKIASVLVKYKNSIIEIEGHTDNVPISTAAYENNRELSAERARSVYEYIMTQESFVDQNMKIAGYGESRPIASNATEEGRAKNRRVTIKIYNQQNSVN